MFRIVPPIIWIACVLLILVIDQIVPGSQSLPFFARAFGIAMCMVGIGMGFNTVQKFIRLNTEVHTFRPASTLSTNGLFRFSRNPVYLGQTLALAGLSVFLGSPASLIAALLFWSACHFHYIPFEEKNLERVFADEYLEYKKMVRRWI